MNLALSNEQIDYVLGVQPTHKDQPMAQIIKGLTNPKNSGAFPGWNTERAISRLQRSDSFGVWLAGRIAVACESNFENATAALGEIRAAGELLGCGFGVEPVPAHKDGPTPDLKVELNTGPLYVEVHTKNMNQDEARKLEAFLGTGGSGHVVRPAGGKPQDPTETTAENVASKFAQIKPRALQTVSGCPAVLWLDLQDQDWWTLSARDTELAWVGNDGEFFTSGLWHAFYGVKGTRLLERHAVEQRAERPRFAMRFDGMFSQHRKWAAAVLSFRRDTVVFEHPAPDVRLPAEFLERATKLTGFDYGRCWLEWPPGRPSLASRLEEGRSHLEELFRVARSRW